MGKSITDVSSVTTVGLHLAKHVFQVHGVDASGRVVVAKAIRRNKLLEFFASAALLDRIIFALPAGVTARALGPMPMRGKEQSIALYALEAVAPTG